MYDHLNSCDVATTALSSASARSSVQESTACHLENLTQRQEQFADLVTTVSDTLYTTALRWSGNHANAEDLVQETQLCAWRNFDRFALGTCFKAWIFQILRFLSWNRQRSAASRQFPTDFQDGESLLCSNLQTETRMEGFGTDWETAIPELVDDRLKRALDGLTPDQRTLALCISLCGFTYQECADEFGIPIGTVMSRYWRARTKLRQELRRSTTAPFQDRKAMSDDQARRLHSPRMDRTAGGAFLRVAVGSRRKGKRCPRSSRGSS